MTTKEQWKLGILIAAMLIIAVAVAPHRIERAIAQPQPTPAYRPPPIPVVAPVVVAPVQPKYPINKIFALTQNSWSEEVSVNDGEHLEWHVLDENAWLDTRANRTEEFRQFPLNDTRWKPLSTPSDTRTLSFRITPGTPVRSANIEITIQQAVGGGFFARERRLPSVTPSLTDAGVKAGPLWPSEIQPTRFGKFPPPGPNPGNFAHDTVYPIEDVMYQIADGWEITPLADFGRADYEVAKVSGGFRLRVLNPDTPIIVNFKMMQTQNKDAASGQRPPVNQGIFNRNSTQTMPTTTQPGGRPYVPPRQPSFYPTSPTGPSYYPR